MSKHSRSLHAIILFAGLMLRGPLQAELVPMADAGLRLERGFRVEQVAAEDLAHDISSMTLDAHGRIVVSGPGYVRRLEDADHDGRVDRQIELAKLRGTAMGLCYDGPDLLVVADGGLWRHRDRNGDGLPDEAPEKLASLVMGEHGAHAIRKGPDGTWYLIGGNDAGFSTNLVIHGASPVLKPVAGGLVRFSRDFKETAVVAHGFRNPYDFDFTPGGGWVTWDSDCERDFLLPWYVPTRVFAIALGQHHGWQLGSHLRSWARPSYEEDSVQPAHWMGRASPTGVVTYRHRLFPELYRDGVFLLDWTFGRVWFSPADGSKPVLFLEPSGVNGFAPTDAAVATDGSLLISIGGRRTRGGVYRILPEAGSRVPEFSGSMDGVLNAPQPFDAWSRANWEPAARKLGEAEFSRAAQDRGRSAPERMRALEILVDLFGAKDEVAAITVAGDMETPPSVRARALWVLGCSDSAASSERLRRSLSDPASDARRVACESLAAQLGRGLHPQGLGESLAAALNDNRGVRRAARLVSSRLSEADWRRMESLAQTSAPSQRLALGWAALERGGASSNMLVEAALHSLENKPSRADQGRALRLIVRALGDWKLTRPSAEVFTAYEWQGGVPGDTNLVERIQKAALALLESSPPRQDVAREAARVLAMLEDANDRSVQAVLARLTSANTATEDFHFLTVLARLRGSWKTNDPRRIVDLLLGLEKKLGGMAQRPNQVWNDRLGELAGALTREHFAVVEELLKHPDFPKPGHVDIVRGAFFRASDARAAARLFLGAVKKDPAFPWSSPLVDMFSLLTPEEVFPLLRQHWEDPVVGYDVLSVISTRPQPEDRAKLIEKLSSRDYRTLRATVYGMTRLRPAAEPDILIPLLRLLKRSFHEPELKNLRQPIGSAAQWHSRQKFGFNEAKEGEVNPVLYYKPVLDWFASTFPDSVKDLEEKAAEASAPWRETAAKIGWDAGNAERGKKWFQERSCASCHQGPAAMAPSLAGVARRLSKDALLEAVFDPDRSIAPAYQASQIQLRNGDSLLGQIVFESADGVMLLEGPGKTTRLPRNEIVARLPSSRSMMPSNLLEKLSVNDLEDLFAYLRALDP